MPRTALLSRRILGLFFVVLASGSTVLAARRLIKPAPETAPDYRTKGPSPARVVIVEYSDFQCPACRAAVKPLSEILALYGKDVHLVFKHMPLERVHPHARAAAIAAECAGQQGRFWQLHDLLYEHQSDWAESPDFEKLWMGYAKEAGLNLATFSTCRKDPAASAAIDADIIDSEHHWVHSTPTFFINGRRFVGPRQLSLSASLWIEKQLKQ